MGTYYRHLLLKKLNLYSKTDSILEVGCHDGFLLHNFQAKTKTGIDIEIIKKFKDINYIQGDFLKEKIKKHDLVISIEVLEHVDDPKAFINKIKKTGKKLLLSVPSKHILIFPYLFQNYIHKQWGHDYRRGFTKQQIKQLLPNAKIIEWSCPFWRTFYIPLKILWKISPGLTKQLLKLTITLDLKFKNGKKGFYFIKS